MSEVERIDYPFVTKKPTGDDSLDNLEGESNVEDVCREGEKHCECDGSVIGSVVWRARGTADAGRVQVAANFTFSSGDSLPRLEGYGQVVDSKLVRGELKEQGGRRRTILLEECRNPKRWSVKP
jgi:hypothetical protein